VVVAYNGRRHTQTNKSPTSVFFSDDPADPEVKQASEAAAQKMLARNKKPLPPLKVGDKVRIHHSSFYNEQDMLHKKYVPQWSENTFRIYKVFANGFYFVEDDTGYYPTKYNRQDLLKIY